MIGLDTVKEQFDQLVDVAVDTQRRKAANPSLKTSDMTHHLLFMGNPGTGKTQVADRLGEVYYGLGLTEKPDVVKVERKDLVGSVVGETEKKTQEVWDKAKGGVLFIDEAYALANSGSDVDYGRQAIDTLISNIEKDRGNTVVIMAGYPKEMEQLLDANSGMRSRFPQRVLFPDYSADERAQIGMKFLADDEYDLDDDSAAALTQAFKALPAQGNARTVRNLKDSVLRAQKSRLRQEFPDEAPPRDVLREIVPEDVALGVQRYARSHNERPQRAVAKPRRPKVA